MPKLTIEAFFTDGQTDPHDRKALLLKSFYVYRIQNNFNLFKEESLYKN